MNGLPERRRQQLMKLGFIGLGKMGTGMVRNLLRAGHGVTVYNRTRDKAEALVKFGAVVADSPADAARGADAVFTMLADDQAVTDVFAGERGLAAGLARDAVHISSSTISADLARRLAREHESRQQAFLAAPDFERPEAAEAKKLIVVLAGSEEIVERCRPLADAIGRQTFVVGTDPWQANALKLCGNFMIARHARIVWRSVRGDAQIRDRPTSISECDGRIIRLAGLQELRDKRGGPKVRSRRICFETWIERCQAGARGCRRSGRTHAFRQRTARSVSRSNGARAGAA